MARSGTARRQLCPSLPLDRELYLSRALHLAPIHHVSILSKTKADVGVGQGFEIMIWHAPFLVCLSSPLLVTLKYLCLFVYITPVVPITLRHVNWTIEHPDSVFYTSSAILILPPVQKFGHNILFLFT